MRITREHAIGLREGEKGGNLREDERGGIREDDRGCIR